MPQRAPLPGFDVVTAYRKFVTGKPDASRFECFCAGFKARKEDVMSAVVPVETPSTNKPMPTGHRPLRRGPKPKKVFTVIPFTPGCRVVMTAKGRAIVGRKSPNSFQHSGVVEALIDSHTILVRVDGQKWSNRWHVSYWERHE